MTTPVLDKLLRGAPVEGESHRIEIDFTRQSAAFGTGITLQFMPAPGMFLPSALEAAKSGVNTVHIVDGRIEHSLLLEVLTEQAFGTMIRSH